MGFALLNPSYVLMRFWRLHSALSSMSKRISDILRQTGRTIGGVARVIGKIALWSIAALAGLWILGKAGAAEAEKAARKPPILTRFEGHENTYTAPFITHGPWQLSWEGNLDSEVWLEEPNSTPVGYDHAAGNGESAFFPSAGTFYLVIRLSEPGWWSVAVRAR